MRTTMKMILKTKLESGSGDQRSVVCTFSANYADGKNKDWAIWTPSATHAANMKGETADRFKIDQEYTVTFEESTPE